MVEVEESKNRRKKEINTVLDVGSKVGGLQKVRTKECRGVNVEYPVDVVGGSPNNCSHRILWHVESLASN